MLVLTRKKSEMIQIGENITIKVIRTGTKTIKIGIDAPDDVRILRSELCSDFRSAKKGDVLELEQSNTENAESEFTKPGCSPIPLLTRHAS